MDLPGKVACWKSKNHQNYAQVSIEFPKSIHSCQDTNDNWEAQRGDPYMRQGT